MDGIRETIIDSAKWAFGVNNLSAIYDINKGEHHFPGDDTALNRAHQLGTEVLHFGLKWNITLGLLSKLYPPTFWQCFKTSELNYECLPKQAAGVVDATKSLSCIAGETPTTFKCFKGLETTLIDVQPGSFQTFRANASNLVDTALHHLPRLPTDLKGALTYTADIAAMGVGGVYCFNKAGEIAKSIKAVDWNTVSSIFGNAKVAGMEVLDLVSVAYPMVSAYRNLPSGAAAVMGVVLGLRNKKERHDNGMMDTALKLASIAAPYVLANYVGPAVNDYFFEDPNGMCGLYP